MPVLTEIGQVEAIREDGVAVTFTPSFLHMAAIGSPFEIVQTYSDLFRPTTMVEAARAVLWACLDDEDHGEAMLGVAGGIGAIPAHEQVILARHLMKHGVSGGNAKPGKKSEGEYSPVFDPSEFIDAAMFHFGLDETAAGRMTMTRFVRMLEMKYPKPNNGADSIDDDEYDKQYAEYMAMREARNGAASR